MGLCYCLEPNQEILKHYYHKECDIHFYQLGWSGDLMFGLILDKSHFIVTGSEKVEKWEMYDCKEELVALQTLGEIFGYTSEIFRKSFPISEKNVNEFIVER